MYVQHDTNSTPGADSLSVTLLGVAPGSMLVILVENDQTVLVTYSGTDDVDEGEYTVAGVNYANTDRSSAILWYGNVSGGDTVVTVNLSASRRFAMTVVEVSDAGASPAVTYGENDYIVSPGLATPATGFSPPADSLILASFAFNANCGTITVGSGYTGMYNNGVNPLGLSEYRFTESLLTDHQPSCTYTTTTRQGPGNAIYIEYKEEAAVIGPFPTHFRA